MKCSCLSVVAGHWKIFLCIPFLLLQKHIWQLLHYLSWRQFIVQTKPLRSSLATISHVYRVSSNEFVLKIYPRYSLFVISIERLHTWTYFFSMCTVIESSYYGSSRKRLEDVANPHIIALWNNIFTSKLFWKPIIQSISTCRSILTNMCTIALKSFLQRNFDSNIS